MLRRRHVFADTIEDIGKESDGWEEDEARTEGQDTVLTYPPSSFDRDRMIAAIKLVGKRELMREAGIAMRTIDAVWGGAEVADDDLKRMADAAERIARRRRKRQDEQGAAVAWLKEKRDEMGLTALAKMLGPVAASIRPRKAAIRITVSERPSGARGVYLFWLVIALSAGAIVASLAIK